MQKIRKSSQGFTLIEIMIVIAIIGILAAIVIPSFIVYSSREWKKYQMEASSFCALHENEVVTLYVAINKEKDPDEASTLWAYLRTLHLLAEVDQATWNKNQKDGPNRRHLWNELSIAREGLQDSLARARRLAGDSLPSLPDGAQLSVNWEFFLKAK